MGKGEKVTEIKKRQTQNEKKGKMNERKQTNQMRCRMKSDE